jgi:ribonucleotide reductase alpha subunit
MGIDSCIKKVVSYAHSGITTQELDNLLAETAAYLNMLHPDCGRLAARIAVTNLHKKTNALFTDTIDKLYNYKDLATGANASLIAKDVYEIVMKNKDRLNAAIIDKRDWDYDFFGYKTLEKSYLLKVEGQIAERP